MYARSVTQPCPTLCDPMDYSLPRLLCPWDFPDKNTGVGCHFLFQRIFETQGMNLHLLSLLHWWVDSSPLSHLGSSFTQPRLIFTPKLFPQDGFRVQVCPLSKQSKTKWALFFLRPAGPQERVTLGILGREYISYMSSIPMLFTCFSDFFTLYLKIE